MRKKKKTLKLKTADNLNRSRSESIGKFRKGTLVHRVAKGKPVNISVLGTGAEKRSN